MLTRASNVLAAPLRSLRSGLPWLLRGRPEQSVVRAKGTVDGNHGGWRRKLPDARGHSVGPTMEEGAVFSFLYLKKIKISKIYVGFGKF